MKKYINFKNKAERQLFNELGLNRNVKLFSTLIEKAQDYTGLETAGVKTLLNKVHVIKRQKQFDFDKERADKFNFPSVKQYREAKELSKQVLKSLSTGYSMGEMKHLYIKNPNEDYRLFTSIDNTQEYANSCSYSATHGKLKVRLTKREFNALEMVEGVPTIKLSGNKCKWLESKGTKQYFELQWIEGYLIGTSHARSKEKARELERKKNLTKNLNKNNFIGIEHLQRIGACLAGIKAFCNRNGLNHNLGYRIDYLLSLNDSKGNRYFKRLIK